MEQKLTIGDKVICVDDFDSPSKSLTKNKIYTIFRIMEEMNGFYSIGVDEIKSYSFCSNRFISIVKYRKDKLNKIKQKITR